MIIKAPKEKYQDKDSCYNQQAKIKDTSYNQQANQVGYPL